MLAIFYFPKVDINVKTEKVTHLHYGLDTLLFANKKRSNHAQRHDCSFLVDYFFTTNLYAITANTAPTSGARINTHT